MRTKTTLQAQAKKSPYSQVDPVEKYVSDLKEYATRIDGDGVYMPEYCAIGWHGGITLIEDRQTVVKAALDKRFDGRALSDVLAAARSVTILCFLPNRGGGRIGQGRADEQSLTLCDRLQTGAAVVVLTTSKRLRFWLGEARRLCPREALIEYYDGVGVTRVSEGGL